MFRMSCAKVPITGDFVKWMDGWMVAVKLIII